MPDLHFLPILNGQTPDLGPRSVLEAWIAARLDEMTRAFAAAPSATVKADPKAILAVLLHHEFNYQSKGKTAHLAPALLERFAALVDQDQPLPIYFLYHGGYRTQVGEALGHTFSPDLTELLLLAQIARLKTRIEAIHAPGLRFEIVINNGVAAYTNGIPYDRTNGYVAKLRSMIDRLGAAATVGVLNQAELGDFAAHMAGLSIAPKDQITEAEHGIVERFLGRTCAPDEAKLKIATYEQAESVWGQEIRAIVAKAGGLFCRQIAHPACLSFRPFPGGAIRVQNGAVTLRLTDGLATGAVKPAFVTPLTWDRTQPIPIGLDVPLLADLQACPTAQRLRA